LIRLIRRLGPAWTLLRTLYRDWEERGIPLRARALVYATLVALVPMLAVAFAVFQMAGGAAWLEPLLERLLAPLGPAGQTVAERLVALVDGIALSGLGWVGAAVLLLAAARLLARVESTVAGLWQAPRARRWYYRAGVQVGVLLLGPVVVLLVPVLWGALPLAGLGSFLAGIAPLVLVPLGFALLYAWVPPVPVQARPALIAGAGAGVAWLIANALFGAVIVGSGRMAAVYSGFATGLVFMLWLYWSWLIFLTGARLAFYIQHPRYLGAGPARRASDRERLRLEAAYWLVRCWWQGDPVVGAEELARRLGRGPDEADGLLEDLVRLGVARREKRRPPRYRLARKPEAIPMKRLFPGLPPETGPAPVQSWVRRLAEGRQQALGQATLADLLDKGDDGNGG
jgi:membrane protein